MSAQQLSSISPIAITGLTATQSMQLTSACSGFTGDQFGNIQNITFSGFTSACISATQPNIWLNATAYQISYLSLSACEGFGSIHLQYLVHVAANLSQSQINSITKSGLACTELDFTFLNSLSLNGWAGIAGPCISFSPTNAWMNVTAQQLSTLSPDAVSAFSSFHMAVIPPESFSGWKSDHVAAFSAKSIISGCAGLGAKQIAHLSTTSFIGFRSACVSIMPYTAFSLINEAQLSEILPAVFEALTAQHVFFIPASAMAGLSPLQMLFFTSSACSGFTADQVT